MTTSFQRDVARDLEALGFEHRGQTSKNHAVYQHPAAGRIVVAGTPSDKRGAKNIVATAKRQLRASETAGHAFANHLCRLCDVGDAGEREVELAARREAAAWLQTDAAKPYAAGRGDAAVMLAARRTGRLELIHNGRGRTPSVWRLRGRDWKPAEPERVERRPYPLGEREPEEAEVVGVVYSDEPAANGSATADVVAELARLVRAGAGAELHERDERIAIAVQALAAVIADAGRIQAAALELVRELDEAVALLDGSTEPSPR